MRAQKEFLEKMKGFRLAQEHPDLIDKAPSEIEHNLLSKTFRNGIAIIGFSILEHFIRERTGELLVSFDKVRIPFSNLPKELQESATKGAIEGIMARMKFNDPINFTQDQSYIIASSKKSKYQISKFSIGWKSSNLRVDSINEIFNCFQVNYGWQIIDDVSGQLNLRIPSSQDAFKNAYDRRNDAAHDIHANIPSLDLENFIREAYAIALGFDLIASTAYKKIYMNDTNYLVNRNKITEKDIIFRTISPFYGRWQEYRKGAKRIIKTSNSKKRLFDDARRRAKKNNEFFICFESNGFPSFWTLPSISI